MTIEEISKCAKGETPTPKYMSEPDVLAYMGIASILELYKNKIMDRESVIENQKVISSAYSIVTANYEWILAYCGKSMKIAEIERQARNETDADKLRQLVFDMIHIYRTLEKEATWEGE